MAFTVETGTGVTNANAYIDVAYADAYFTDRGITAWTAALTPAKQIAIIKATDYIETRWGRRFLGSGPLLDTQGLSFPRRDTFTGIPEGLKRATAEYAVRALTDELMPDPTTDASGGMIIGNRQKVGPIETEVTFSASAGVSALKPYPAADRLMTQYLRSSSGGVIRN